MPMTSVERKKVDQPIASTATPAIGPGEQARQREQAREERVLRRREALLRHAQQQHREGAGAQARVNSSKLVAPYISGSTGPPASDTK